MAPLNVLGDAAEMVFYAERERRELAYLLGTEAPAASAAARRREARDCPIRPPRDPLVRDDLATDKCFAAAERGVDEQFFAPSRQRVCSESDAGNVVWRHLLDDDRKRNLP